MYQGTKNSFALPVELTAKFFGLQYRNRTDDIKITFIVAASALSIVNNLTLLLWLATSIVSLTSTQFHLIFVGGPKLYSYFPPAGPMFLSFDFLHMKQYCLLSIRFGTQYWNRTSSSLLRREVHFPLC